MTNCFSQENVRLAGALEGARLRKVAEEQGIVVKTAKDIQKVKSNFFPLLEVRFHVLD